MKLSKKIFIAAAITILLVFQLIFLYFIKYNNQLLSISDISLSNIGNIFNLVTFSLLIIGIIIYSFQKNNKLLVRKILFFILVSTLFLFGAYFSTVTTMPFEQIYFLGQHGNKLFTGLLFILYLTIFLIFVSYIWLSIFGRNKFLILQSLIISILVLLAVILFAFYYVSVSDPKIDNEKILESKDNIAVVLGAAVWSKNKPSPILAARVEKSIELLENNLVGRIKLTGSNAPGELSEAEVAYNYAISLNADSTKMSIENKTTSTNEQIIFIRENLLSQENVNQVIVISDDFHLVRIDEISRFNNIKIYAVSSDLKLSFENDIYNRLRESIGLFFFWFFAI